MAVAQQVGQAPDGTAELLNSSDPLVVPEIVEARKHLLGLTHAVLNARLQLRELLLLDDSVGEAEEHCIVLVGGQILNRLLVQDVLKGVREVVDKVVRQE